MWRFKKLSFVLTAVLVTQLAVIVALEASVRLFRGTLTTFDDVRDRPDRTGHAPWVDYDERLGNVPKPGVFVRPEGFTTSVDKDRLRRGLETPRPEGSPILVVGDSFAFGAEVNDGEDFPAVLERLLERPVLNAGVGAYGIDQAILRAERLLPVHHPDTLIVALISDDVERAEFSYFFAWKPYFTVGEGELELHNVPVPRGRSRISSWKALAIRIQLAHEYYSRLDPDWWYLDGRRRGWRGGNRKSAGGDGVEITKSLVARIAKTTREQSVRLLLVALRPKDGDVERLAPVLAHAREIGVEVVDLVPGITRLAELNPENRVFRPKGHLSPASNEWVAEQLAAVLSH